MTNATVTGVEPLPSGGFRYYLESESGELGGLDSLERLPMNEGDQLEFEGLFQEPSSISFAGQQIWRSSRR